MPFPLQITFQGISHSEAIESDIRQRAAGLERFRDQITACNVTVDIPHHHRHRGNHHAMRIEISTASGNFTTSREPTRNDSKKDFHSVIRDAFQLATRFLEQGEQSRQGNANDPTSWPRGVVARLFAEDGYGFLTTPGGEEVYFSHTSMLDGAFARLAVGSVVGFVLAAADRDSDEVARAANVQLVPTEEAPTSPSS